VGDGDAYGPREAEARAVTDQHTVGCEPFAQARGVVYEDPRSRVGLDVEAVVAQGDDEAGAGLGDLS
jgi:hypothetical protein